MESQIAQLLAQMTNMTADIGHVKAAVGGTAEIKATLQAHDAKFVEMQQQIDEANKNAMAALDKAQHTGLDQQLEARFLQLESSTARMQSSSASVNSDRSKRNRIGTGPTGSTGASTDGFHLGRADADCDRTKVWIGGFTRKMLAASMSQFARSILTNLPTHERNLVQIKAYNLNKSFSLKFSSVEQASEFVQRSRDNPEMLTYADPVTIEKLCLRARVDAPHDVRSRNKILGSLWQSTITFMKGKGSWKGKMKLGSNGFRGILFLIDGEAVQGLYVVSEDASDNVVIVPDAAALKKVGFAEAGVTTATDIAKAIKR
ncbi:unnamed protein product [Prorocentrum cordatum]|uniref:Uncharacterized protein n=1 Tax=Prorocentrum cordatum TaxID=2364126 RepID=A0ABN9UVS9_9DINO|nr:unnamed protein product [Polarella glacialis]